MHPRYEEWIEFVFNHEDPDWHYDIDASEFDVSEQDHIILITETFMNASKDLERFSDEQIGAGLWYLCNENNLFRPSFNILPEEMKSQVPEYENISLEIRLRGINSIYDLYNSFFSKKCDEVLGYLREKGNPINTACYMFWDIPYLGLSDFEPEIEEAALNVLKKTIQIPHKACVEGGLHGLGHISGESQSKAKDIIDRFIKENNDLDEELLRYAKSARLGCIQ